ncbi:MAG: glycoside hydrolase [Desulfobacteraceae bacterium]|nr:glycoside hydrolase [Desulfobacteraceae bacterium]
MFSKKYLKTKPICKVTFRLSANEIGDAQNVNILGEFNNWDLNATPMKRLKSGDFSYVLNLEKDHAYQFRYLIDNETYMNDTDADAYLPSPFPGIDNSVIAL